MDFYLRQKCPWFFFFLMAAWMYIEKKFFFISVFHHASEDAGTSDSPHFHVFVLDEAGVLVFPLVTVHVRISTPWSLTFSAEILQSVTGSHKSHAFPNHDTAVVDVIEFSVQKFGVFSDPNSCALSPRQIRRGLSHSVTAVKVACWKLFPFEKCEMKEPEVISVH